MGLTVLNLEVANPAALERREEVEFLVDSGAVYSFVPRAVLERLGIQAHSRQVFRLADGSTIERDRGDAVFFYRNARGAAPVRGRFARVARLRARRRAPGSRTAADGHRGSR